MSYEHSFGSLAVDPPDLKIVEAQSRHSLQIPWQYAPLQYCMVGKEPANDRGKSSPRRVTRGNQMRIQCTLMFFGIVAL